jgi:transposase
MARYVEGWDRCQSFLLPERVDDCVDENNPVRVIEVFVGQVGLAALGFCRAVLADTGRPGYHPGGEIRVVACYAPATNSSRVQRVTASRIPLKASAT